MKLLQSTRIKIAQKYANLEFLKMCRDNKIIAHFAIIKRHLHNNKNESLFKSLSLSLVRHDIKNTHPIIRRLSENVCPLHLKIVAIIRFDLWDMEDSAISMRHDSKHDNITSRKKRKFNTLHSMDRSAEK